MYFLVNTKYETRNHSKFLLMYHVIFVCKYQKVILEPISEELKQIRIDISKESNFEILMETDKDRIHFLIKSEPKVSVLSIVRKLKQGYTNRLWKTQKEYLKKYYWGENTLWSDGYFASTIGNVSKEAAEYYIRNQG
ncbi:IS200/IS605 family transposase [Methanosarcina sp. WWM596]|uniref:IS200/IS605 family transposase n=1 Tax=Methanosarcina sp. WWM596 TaxID=1434103 RepID=UPI00064F60FC|nr:IS200/IS605 family transposase [Methanosarcina sp. WWM596]